MVRKFKITVIKKFSPEDVFGEEGFQFKNGEKDKICDLFEEGQEFTFEGVKKPEGFPCEWAWNDLFNDIMELGAEVILCELALENKGIDPKDLRDERIKITKAPPFLMQVEDAALTFTF